VVMLSCSDYGTALNAPRILIIQRRNRGCVEVEVEIEDQCGPPGMAGEMEYSHSRPSLEGSFGGMRLRFEVPGPPPLARDEFLVEA
jgi:hypothetical protein